MAATQNTENHKMIKRLNATLPDALARFVGEVTGKGGLYETPSEFIRDLIRRYMENAEAKEADDINQLLAQSLAENDYSRWSANDMAEIRETIQG